MKSGGCSKYLKWRVSNDMYICVCVCVRARVAKLKLTTAAPFTYAHMTVIIY